MKKGETRWGVLIPCLFIVAFISFMGSQFNSSVNSTWYNSIKPSITPPNIVFPVVWTILFFLIALSLYFAWINSNLIEKVSITAAFGLNFFFNVAWTALYFGLKNPSLALFDLICLLLSIILMMRVTYKIDKKSTYLLIPYLIWVIFAGILNYLSIR